MLKTIAEIAPELLTFIEALDLPLSKPQKQHIAQVADALITTEGSPKTYLVRSLTGKLSCLSEPVRVFISKRHNRDRHPHYFTSTDPSLSAHRVLNDYHTRCSRPHLI